MTVHARPAGPPDHGAAGPRRDTALVTGLDVRAANGSGTEAFWQSLLEGRGGIGPITRFDASGYPSRLAGEIACDPTATLPGRLLPQTDRVTRLALTSAAQALLDSGLDPAGAPEYGVGVVTANAAGGFEFGQRELEALWAKGPRYVSAYQSFAWFYAVNTGQISIRHGLRGPSGVLVSGQAGGLDAVGHARRMLRKGTPAVLTGAMESALCPWGHVAEMTGGRLSASDRAEGACLPFGEHAAGHVVAEGGALLMLESAAAADARGGTRPYGDIAGYAATFDPPPGSGRPGGPAGAARAALADAGIDPSAIGAVFAEGAAVPELDAQEAAAITEVFGPDAVPVTAITSHTGRPGAGASALDLAAALLAVRDGLIPPTAEVGRVQASYRIDLVTGRPRSLAGGAALVLARGHGGFNSAVVVRRHDERPR
ncbi:MULTISPECIES: beta-ketoacyl synthase N-terminal-like domain-containing protein [unclassified Streptomyces]|uniref:beta-ketoacyl synthase N-terminal-like domain-containing protein n=1 Tax=unclassified Streptomyces TaxID=2593676 RepID=UPI000CD580A7|nr:beta-ketoacyl synthase N-terminal-like domain-containing protein [Streptomyces sp. SM10]